MKFVADRFGIVNTSMILLAAGVMHLSKEDEPQTPEEMEEIKGTSYREIVGALMRAATTTRTECRPLRS